MSGQFSEKDGRDWKISASLANVNQICAELSDWLIGTGLADHLFPIQMLARESLNNAVLHGCGQDNSLLVDCKVYLDGKFLVLEVDDGGPGFNWQVEMEQEMVHNEKMHGRGLWIYHLYADRIEFNLSGNCVKLARTLT